MRRALRPVREITAAAREITSYNLGRRLPVARTHDELEGLSVVLNGMIGRLDEAFQHSRRFTADASHELRTPLTIMRVELESVSQEPGLDAATRERVSSVLEETERLAKTVEGLFAISRLEAGEALMEVSRFDLSELVLSTADQMSLLAEEKHLDVQSAGCLPVDVSGDRFRLKQVIVNLLDNAIKYSQPNGEVSLATRADDGQAVLEVADRGPGIPPEALPQIFDRFFRADSVRTHSESGAGLGLSIVRSICLGAWRQRRGRQPARGRLPHHRAPAGSPCPRRVRRLRHLPIVPRPASYPTSSCASTLTNKAAPPSLGGVLSATHKLFADRPLRNFPFLADPMKKPVKYPAHRRRRAPRAPRRLALSLRGFPRE